jgi:hypothetical protein
MTPSIACVTLAAVLFGGQFQASLKSGPQVGSPNDRDGFRPEFVAGPSTGKRLCPV